MARVQQQTLEEQIHMLGIGVQMTAQALHEQRERTNSVAKATWEPLNRRERPVFIKALRNDGYTQAEIGAIVGLSQPTISQYERTFDMAQGVSRSKNQDTTGTS